MATMRYKWGRRGYVAAAVVTVAIAGAIGYRGEGFEAVVVRVVDGDTLAVQGDIGELILRLWGVDAPEMDQPYGIEAKSALGLLCLGETVHVEVVDVDRYNRRVARIRLPDGRDLSDELLIQGMVWWSHKYAPYDLRKRDLMIKARSGSIGLWSRPQRTPPWDHRYKR